MSASKILITGITGQDGVFLSSYLLNNIENIDVISEENIKLDVFKKSNNDIKLSLSYKINNKKQIVNHLNLFNSFRIINEDLSNYYLSICHNLILKVCSFQFDFQQYFRHLQLTM